MTMSFSGSLEAVQLADIVQMCCLTSVDGGLQLSHGGFVGHIFLRKGQVVHAEAADRKGEDALFLLLSLRQGRFDFQDDVTTTKDTISAEWEYLLIEAARRKDEQPILIFPPSSTPQDKLTEMLQMYCLAFMEGGVRVEQAGIAGHIYLREGQIVHAKVGKKKGEEALYYLLSLEDATFEFQSDGYTPEDSIYGHWEHLLAEGARRRRELEAVRVLAGDLCVFKLADILQMCCVSGLDGDLQLMHNGFYGHIYLREGQIVHAQAGLQKGEQALHFLLSFRQGSFEFRKDETSPDVTIHGRWEYLLLEAARLRDEEAPVAGQEFPAGTRQNGKLELLVKRCSGFRGFKGAVVLSETGDLLASSFAPLETRLIELVANCATLYRGLEKELAVENGTMDKCFVLNFQENSFVAISQPKYLILLLVDRRNAADPLLLDLVRTIRQSVHLGY
jgi:hypothetical protein